MTAARSVVDRDGARKGDLAAIHIAKTALGLDEDSYRDLMSTVCAGVRSAALLDFTGRKRFLAHLQACLRASGLAGGQKGRQRAGGPVREALTPAQKKMWSLWMQLADCDLVHDRSMMALVAFAKRQTGVDRLEWLNKPQGAIVIDSMKQWLKSRGAEPR